MCCCRGRPCCTTTAFGARSTYAADESAAHAAPPRFDRDSLRVQSAKQGAQSKSARAACRERTAAESAKGRIGSWSTAGSAKSKCLHHQTTERVDAAPLGGGGCSSSILVIKRMRLRTFAQSAWTTRMIQLWTGTFLGCVLRAVSFTAVPGKQVGLLTGHLTAQLTVHH